MTTAIIEKIRRILAIAGDGANASEAEIENAMRHAQKLMDKHHLTEADLAHSPEDDIAAVDRATFGMNRSWIGSKAYTWEDYLSAYVNSLVGVQCYCDYVQLVRKNGIVQFDADGEPKRGRSYVFFGIEEDTIIAAELFDELRLMVATMGRMKWGHIYKGDGGTYCEGFVLGLAQKLKESRRVEREEATRRIGNADDASSRNALVLIERRTDLVRYKRKKADDWLRNDKGIKLRSSRSSGGSSGSSLAFNEGQRDGRAANVSANRRRKLSAQ